jgi:hypothetical protein
LLHGSNVTSKFQHPNSKEASITKLPNNRARCLGGWKRAASLKISAWNFSGCWSLEFGAFFYRSRKSGCSDASFLRMLFGGVVGHAGVAEPLFSLEMPENFAFPQRRRRTWNGRAV